MKRLEVILLRSPGEELESLCDRIRVSIPRGADQEVEVTLYRRSGLDTDLAVHIHDASGPASEPSSLALRLANELRAHGLVEHHLWQEIEP